MLPYALHEYRTSVLTSIGATPYSLVYGTEVVLLVEVEIPSLRVLAEAEEGDLVPKKRLPNVKNLKGKWAPNYEGAYVVKKAFSGGALVLVDSEGQELIHPVNADMVKMFYP
ncbi:hypothetical protein CR513_08562, partial [Mucuna pruriens]